MVETVDRIFANGRTAGLVLDSGASQTAAVPVYDGYCVSHAVVRSPIGGDLIAEQCGIMCDEQKIEVVPSYKIASRVRFLLKYRIRCVTD
ncbi:unnamed protein product [Anisakis simplex]|uniref:Peptidase A2 domain-containing protein n=1 Tax=Anisakis simplex TaxID=6269 RepID=A0A0M3KGF7_ANISI|nr:unnamed protein product [Anisakis simplex]